MAESRCESKVPTLAMIKSPPPGAHSGARGMYEARVGASEPLLTKPK